jgi:hypothetical protein
MRQNIARLCFAILYAVLGLPCVSKGLVLGDLGAPEVKGALSCEIQPLTNDTPAGSRIWMSLTIRNTSTLDVSLPSPVSSETGIMAKLLLVSRQATGAVERAILPSYTFGDTNLTPEQKKTIGDEINSGSGMLLDERPYLPSIVLSENATADQRKLVEGTPANKWDQPSQSPAPWLSIPAHGTAKFQMLVEVSPKAAGGDAQPLNPGTCRLQCAIMYFVGSYGFRGALITNDSFTSAKDIAKAKAAGLFLLERNRLWTGKMESNVVQINVIGSPK